MENIGLQAFLKNLKNRELTLDLGNFFRGRSCLSMERSGERILYIEI